MPFIKHCWGMWQIPHHTKCSAKTVAKANLKEPAMNFSTQCLIRWQQIKRDVRHAEWWIVLHQLAKSIVTSQLVTRYMPFYKLRCTKLCPRTHMQLNPLLPHNCLMALSAFFSFIGEQFVSNLNTDFPTFLFDKSAMTGIQAHLAFEVRELTDMALRFRHPILLTRENVLPGTAHALVIQWSLNLTLPRHPQIFWRTIFLGHLPLTKIAKRSLKMFFCII